MDLSIIIPAFNESRRLGPTLQRVVDYLRGRGLGVNGPAQLMGDAGDDLG